MSHDFIQLSFMSITVIDHESHVYTSYSTGASALRQILYEGRVERLIQHEAKPSAVLGLEIRPECNISCSARA